MEVRNCPKCGSDSIEKSGGSKEYSSYVRWTCDSCGWSYQNGKGMGWYDTKGTHPQKLTSTDQSRLTETGEWCNTCETVEKPPHACTARALAEQSDDPLTQDTVKESLSEYHYNPSSQITDELNSGGVQLTPTFFRITTWDKEKTDDQYVNPPKEPMIADDIRHELRDGGQMKISSLCDRLAAESNIETTFVLVATEEMDDVKRDLRAGLRLDE